MQIFGTRFQVTLGDLRFSVGFSVDHATPPQAEVSS